MIKSSYISIYNNKAIGIVCFDAVLKRIKKISISKALLIIPLLTHKNIVAVLKNKKANIRCIEELIIKKQESFIDFDRRYYSFLETSIDVIEIMSKLDIVEINNGYLEYIEENGIGNYQKMGERALEIEYASEKLANILKETDINLYLHLGVQI